MEQRGVGNYHALQIGLNKRFSNGLSFLTNYTWSKAIENPASNYGNTGHQNVRNLDADRALAGVDLRHRWVRAGSTSFLFARASNTWRHLPGWSITSWEGGNSAAWA